MTDLPISSILNFKVLMVTKINSDGESNASMINLHPSLLSQPEKSLSLTIKCKKFRI